MSCIICSGETNLIWGRYAISTADPGKAIRGRAAYMTVKTRHILGCVKCNPDH